MRYAILLLLAQVPIPMAQRPADPIKPPVAWHTSYASAAAERRPMLVYMFTTPCPWCDKLAVELAKADLSGFALLKTDDRNIVKKFGVDRFPTMVILDSSGKFLRKQVGYTKDIATFLRPKVAPARTSAHHAHQCGLCGTVFEHGPQVDHRCPHCGHGSWTTHYRGAQRPTYRDGVPLVATFPQALNCPT